MAASKSQKGRKIGNKIKKPSAKRRKIERPELYRKARRVLASNGPNGEAKLTAWVDFRYGKGDPAPTLHDAARKARGRKAALAQAQKGTP